MSHDLNRLARIMIVDDEPANLKLLSKLLSSRGYSLLTPIEDSRQVISSYVQSRPDLILLDINMPHLNGYQLIEQLHQLDDPLLPPIVILTAELGREQLVKALAAGARDFLSKPFDATELFMRVRNLLDAYLAHRLLHDQKAMLEAIVQLRTEALNQTRLQVVRSLSRASEFRDNETGMHIVRMSLYSALLAKHLGWAELESDLMLHASPMHDVGKIGIPDAILLKPGKFTLPEWNIMKTHATIGAEILSTGDSDLLQMASSIALTHHEKWDGTGYPKGLAGEAIPQEGRIVAVADVFDALTSERPYKTAWPVEAAIAHIHEQSGLHFDPAVVAQFQHCLPEIMNIRTQHAEPALSADQVNLASGFESPADCPVGQQ